MKKILITGSNGFIGRHLAEDLDGIYQIYTPSKNMLNLFDQELTESFLREMNFDVIIHCANVNSTRIFEGKQKPDDYMILDGNLRMFYNIVRCKKEFGKMFYFGSGAEYGREVGLKYVGEDFFGVHIPKDPYGFSKYIMAEYCNEKSNIFDFRLFGVFGEYEEWSRRFISNAICRGLKNLPITISQNVFFDYLWVHDLSNIMKWAIENNLKYRHYNICRGEHIDLLSLANNIKKEIGWECPIEIAKEGLKPEYSGTNRRLLDEMGKFQFTSFDTAIHKMVNYYREHINEISFDSNNGRLR